MEPKEAIQRIKQDMAMFAGAGRAARLCGIIVSPEVYQALEEDSEDFHGFLRVTGLEGNRGIRYTFFVLRTPNFPHQKSAVPYFFVPYPREAYEKRYLGREEEILTAQREEVVLGGKMVQTGHNSWFRIQEAKLCSLNPIAGVVSVDNWYLYRVDFEEVLAVARRAEEAGEPITATVRMHFDEHNLAYNPPETWRIKDGDPFDLDAFGSEAAFEGVVGRLLMEKTKPENPYRQPLYRLVGIGRDGYGRVVRVPAKETERRNPYEFACLAVHDFLPEEVAEFLKSHGVQVPLEWIMQIPVKEVWGTWHDPEGVGRLEAYRRISQKEAYIIAGGFVNTRGKEYRIDLVEVGDEEEWVRVQSEYFPADWKGWDKTAHDRAFEAVAQTL